MNKKSKKRPAAKKGAASIDSRKGGSDSPAIVVGVGASAGGTKSLQRFFAKMPAGHGLAFVLIQHMGRGQKSIPVKSVKNQTAFAIVEAKEGMPVLADCIHVIPPDKFLSISGGKLTLQEPVLCNGLRMPIDHFFCSLAFDQRHRSIGVLLSGKGSDGTLGLSEIKAAGGRTVVEAPASAAYPDMPQSAIDGGVAGKVMPAVSLAEVVTEIAAQLMAEPRGPLGQQEPDADLRSILDILRAKVGHDFRCYKPGTLIRRIKRRMSLAKITSMDVYARFLHEHPEEVGLLQKDLLIGVTDFFRQPHAWETLEDKVIASIVEGAQPGSEIRVWVPGCSTGKEAYSLAMVLAEHVERSGKKVTVQIFATDSDLTSLATARSGVYPKEEFGDNVSPERLKRFFVRKDGRYQVAKDLRELIVFAPQNITADPPFSRLDLISCRNLLIYLDQEVQKKIIALFHFALREGGFLFLGTAETVGDREELFEPVSKKWRIYRRIGVGRRVGVEIPVRPTVAPSPADNGEPARTFAKAPPVTPPSRMSLTSGAQHMLLDRFAPACVMIDRKLQVLYVHGAVEDYLTFPPGELTTRVVDMAREGLRARLRGAIAKCLQSNKSASITARIRRGDRCVAVRTVVSPLRYPREIDGLLLITFEDYRIPVAKTSHDADAAGNIRHLEDELKITREELQSTIEQLENSNDELKASNEEVTAANEELQSANEELETSKEELQSLNEELNTINVRLHDKVDELECVNNDVVNLLSSTSIATVFLDRELKVKLYTPASTRLMSLIPTDTGRHIADILCRFSDETLLDDARLVLADLTPLSQEVQADDGRWYIRRITPYRTQDDRIEGVVITFVDVADLKKAEEELRESQHRLAVIVDSIADGFYALDRDWRFTHVNDAALRHMGKTREEILGRTLFGVYPEARGTVIANEYGSAMESGEPHHFESPSLVTDRILEIHAYPGPENLTVLFRDVTEQKRMAAALSEAHERAEWLARFPDENPNPVMRVSTDGNALYCNPASSEMPGWACEAGQQLPDPLRPLLAHAKTTGQEAQQDVELGEHVYSVSVVPISGEGYANIYGRDITERKRAEEALRERERLLQDVIDGSTSPIFLKDRDGKFITINATLEEMLGMSREEIKGKTDYDIAPKEVADFWREHDKKVMAIGKAIQIEEVADLQDGHHIFLANKFPLVDAHGQIYGVGSISHDITERKREEEALRTNEESLRRQSELLEHAPVLVRNLNDEIILWNSGMENMYGYSRGEALEKVSHDLLQTRHPQPLAEIISQIRNEGQWEGELHHKGKDGKEIIVASLQMLHRDAGGNAAAIIEVNTDITARKQAEEALKTVLQRLNAVVAGMQSSILLVGEGRIEMANQAFCDYFGLQESSGDLVGLTPRQLIDKIKNAYLHPDEQVRRIWEIARGGQPVIGEEISMRDGRTSLRDFIPIHVNGISYGLLWQHIDITERKEKEGRIAKLTRLYAALSRVNETIVRIRDEGSLYDEVCQILSEEGNFPLVWIGQVEQKQIVPAAWYGAASGYLKEIKVETEGHFGQGPTGTSIREHRAVIKDDFATSPALSPWREAATRFGFRSSAAFPLVRGGKAIASLTLYSSVSGAFDVEQVRLLESLSADISYALDVLSQDRLRRAADEAVRESEERFRLLSSTAGRLLRADEPQAIVEDLCRDVMAYLDCQAFFNFLVDEKAGRLRLNACAGIPEEEARAIEWLDYGVAVCGCVAQARQRIIAEDILYTPDVRTDLVRSYGIQAYCCHPLMAQNRLIGTLSFGTKTRPHFNPEEVELMRTVTDQVAVAMERKRAEEALRRLNEELEQRVSERTAELWAASLYSRSLIEASLDPLVTISPEGKVTDVNEATERVTGRNRSELIGTEFSDYFTEPDAAQAGYRKVLTEGQVRDYPLTIRDASGNTADVLYNATVYRNAQGEVQGVFAAARDVTETKRVEAELVRHREHLEDMVKERTAELEAANRELESFSYSVSHDLRAPLRAIDGYARMILKKEGDKFDEETMRKFNVIRSSSQMMGQLIDDILKLSRVVKKHLSTSQLEMDTIIKEAWKELETINPERNMKLTVQDYPAAYGDRTLIKQVYANLLSNAVKFTKYRDPALIETGGYVEGNENVYYVRDNGVGFEMEYYDKLFGIFQRLHKPDEFEGTGVGLATVERIVQRHGGRAWAEGKVNEGATFYFTLPQRR